MRVLVTGAAGFLGINLVRRCALGGARVEALARREPDDEALRYLAGLSGAVRWHRGDVTDLPACRRLVQELRPDAVLHAAAVTVSPLQELANPRTGFDVNVGGTLNLLEAARLLGGLRFVYVSSGGLYGPAPPSPALDETAPIEGRGMYAIAKRTSERLCIRYSELGVLEARIGRMGTAYGPMERATASRTALSAVHQAVEAALGAAAAASAGHGARGVRVAGSEIARDFIHVEDVADALWHLAVVERLPERIYNIGAPIAEPLSTALDVLARELPGFAWSAVADGEEADVVQTPQSARAAMDIARMTRDTPWRPRFQLPEGVRAYLAWRSHGG